MSLATAYLAFAMGSVFIAGGYTNRALSGDDAVIWGLLAVGWIVLAAGWCWLSVRARGRGRR